MTFNPKSDYHYNAFISYRHGFPDKIIAARLHRLLETYKVPSALVKKGAWPITRIFLDLAELPSSSNLSDDIAYALSQSQFLIVLCSRSTPESEWVAREIETFIELGRAQRILPVIIEGEPRDSFPLPLLALLDHLEGSAAREDDSNLKESINGKWKLPVTDLRGKDTSQILNNLKEQKLELITLLAGVQKEELWHYHQQRLYWQRGLALTAALTIATIYGFYSNDLRRQAEESSRVATIKLAEAQEAEQIAVEQYQKAGEMQRWSEARYEEARRLEQEAEKYKNETEQAKQDAESQRATSEKLYALAEERRKQSVEQKNLAMQVIRSLTYDVPDKLQNIAGTKTILVDVLAGNLGMLDRIMDVGRELSDPKVLREKSVNFSRMGDTWIILGDVVRAKAEFEKGLVINEELGKDRTNAQAQRDLSVSYERLGDVAITQGDLPGARIWFEKALAIAEELAKDRTNEQAQRNLSISYDRLGEVSVAQGDLSGARIWYEKALAITEELSKDLTNAQAQRDLSFSYDRLGEVSVAQGDLSGARIWYEKALAIREELAKDQTNAEAQRGLSISYNNIGEVAVAQGDLSGARIWYEKALTIAEELAKDRMNAEAQRYLSLCYERLGEVAIAQGDLSGARIWYEKALTIAEELAKDRTNTQAQRDLSIS
ncbi:tetratricopeptide repeat protein [Heliobacillus mobilis]|uniref:Tetratricopeptide repeat protein n=1 Tax=Heliobacterium mobile TaxID=28064 RepID=A0A6I3SIY4_HELMO|nr:tetratricopeptide repeat protein [Heliobacterium mobile]MTV48849.1 tetratricopeptide repeat protein [Heliobacterium mobile]